jgi:HSP20 family protein
MMHRIFPRASFFWDPFGEMAQLWERMGQLFESAGQGGREGWVPVVETEETADAYLVRAELPGMKRDNIDIELRGNELRITGKVEEESGGKTLRQRRSKFAYHTSLPADADAEKVEVRLADGVLTVRLPKRTQAVGRRIEIKD